MFFNTTSEIIDQVGGTTAFAKWYGAGVKAVDAWRGRRFPARTYLKMTTRLKAEFNIEGPSILWGQDQ